MTLQAVEIVESSDCSLGATKGYCLDFTIRTEVMGRGTLPGLCAHCLPLALLGRWGSRTKPGVLTTRLLILVETSPLLLILLINSLHFLASLQIKVEFKSGEEEGFVANQVHRRWLRTHHPHSSFWRHTWFPNFSLWAKCPSSNLAFP